MKIKKDSCIDKIKEMMLMLKLRNEIFLHKYPQHFYLVLRKIPQKLLKLLKMKKNSRRRSDYRLIFFQTIQTAERSFLIRIFLTILPN